MKKILYILLVISLISCNNKSKIINAKSANKADTIFYKYKGFNNGMKLYLFSDNTFSYDFFVRGCTGGGEFGKITGNYIRKEYKLLLKPDSIFIKILDAFSHSEYKRYKLKYKDDSLRIKTKYDIIKWNNVEYLISPQKDKMVRNYIAEYTNNLYVDSIFSLKNDYNEFSHYYNSGSEPKKHGRYLTQVIASKDSISEKLQFKRIPEKWRSLFLEKPLVAKIIKINKEQSYEGDNEKYYNTFITLNKGSQDRVSIGMIFYANNDKGSLEIIKVSKNESIGIVNEFSSEEFSLNEILKTNWNN